MSDSDDERGHKKVKREGKTPLRRSGKGGDAAEEPPKKAKATGRHGGGEAISVRAPPTLESAAELVFLLTRSHQPPSSSLC